MQLNFYKMCGAGNDFIVIDNRKNIVKDNLNDLARKMCAIKYGVGADGLIIVEKSDIADFKMRIFNLDGSEADMCGNGARCVAYAAYIQKIAKNKMSFETKAGIIKAEVTDKELVKIKLSDPHDILLKKKEFYVLREFEYCFVNTGVPHAVIFVDDVEKIDVYNFGRFVRNNEAFEPQGTNVNFVEVVKDSQIKVRTYERGVENETLACGTGSTASAIICGLLKKCVSPVSVVTRGGSILNIYFKLHDKNKVSDVYLEGDAKVIFEGKLVDSQ